ncbi:MFS transporter [Burkholderia sp. LMG 21824]|uniref:MFS transporter n=1 Tax=Burkholderia sp. LMG 21824 TaxID=3158172 RepID=UPI003C2B0720
MSILGRGKILGRIEAAAVTAFFLSNLATFMVMPIMAVYLSGTLNFSADNVGCLLSVYFCSARITPLIFGALTDRVGRSRFINFGLLVRAVGFGLLGLHLHPVVTYIGAIAIGLGGAAFETGVYSLVQGLSKESREKTIVSINFSLNVGVIAGPLLGAILSFLSTEIVFVLSAIIFFSMFVLSMMVPYSSFECETVVRRDIGVWRAFLIPLTSCRFIGLLLVMLPWFFLFSQLFIYLPIRASEIGNSMQWSHSVFVVNGVVGIVFLPLFGGVVKGRNSVFLVSFCYLMAVGAFYLATTASQIPLFLIGVAIFSVAEVLILPAAEIVVSRVSPSDLGGAFFGTFNAVFGMGGAIGNMVGSRLSLTSGGSDAWVVLSVVACVGVAASLVYAYFEKTSEESEGIVS